MHLRRSTLLALLLPLLPACHAARAEANVAPAEAVPAPQEKPGAAAATATRDGWVRAELRGAPYERATQTSLAVLVPREPAGEDADARARRAFAALTTAEQMDLLEWF